MMKKYFCFTIIMYCISIATSGQSTIRITPQQVRQIDSLMNSLHESEKFNGLILVATGNEVIYSKGFGYANREKKIDNDPSYIFPIMSLTKQFTVALILKLVEEGKLDLNKPFINYLPQYQQEHWGNITIHDLLRQTSGIPDYIPYLKAYDGSGGENKYHSPDTLVGKIVNKPLNFQPGEKFQYCNVNYVLLGLIVERVTGKPIADALSLYITGPLQLDHTSYDLNSLPRTTLTGVIIRSRKTTGPVAY